MEPNLTVEQVQALVQSDEYKTQRAALSPARTIVIRSVADRQQDLMEEAAAAGLTVEELIHVKAQLIVQERQQPAEATPKAKRSSKKVVEPADEDE